MNNDLHYYLQLVTTETNKHCGWAFYEPTTSFYYVHPSALYAEAFSVRRVEKARQTIQTIVGATVQVVSIECNSRSLIPDQMKKVINL